MDKWTPRVLHRKAKLGLATLTTNEYSTYVYFMWHNDHPNYPHGITSESYMTVQAALDWADKMAEAHYGGWED